MKFKSIFYVSLLFIFLSGCFIYSFYPLYTDDDLFANDIMLGEWMGGDSTIWKFEYKKNPRFSMSGNSKTDSTVYLLSIKDKDDDDFSNEYISVRVVNLDGNYFLDFHMDDYPVYGNTSKFGIFLFPVHVFAKLEFGKNNATIKYFNPGWLGELIEENKIEIDYKMTDERVLLTAKPKELQKFVLKYVNSEEAFEDEYTVNLIRQ